ncbi:uncharacterized protein LOC113147590 [Cyclospora cayetanensis]|uniref:Uncharacterized protein LOC113147590 n=1 Tax=Cyclospora cayetanensis TaxID=88456 RepID=A0A6P6S2T8_9EIME|nr:uncharacterized protein LOC113147590 [Cyclospora cayetanensis]
MAFRFRREGQYVKSRVHLDRSGFKPFMKELKWEIFEWHYKRHMGPLAVRALMQHQQGSEKLQYLQDISLTGGSSKFLSPDSSRFFFATALPIVRPVKRSSNPFCLLSANKTGFVYHNENPNYLKKGPSTLVGIPRLTKRRTGYPNPHGKRKIGGTDPTPPVFPKGV